MSARQLRASVWRLGLAAVSLKLLLVPAAHSTDLEVHRWWKALTYSYPMRDWYTNTESVWTLDYPPLFAYFERFLAELAALLYPPIVDRGHHNNESKLVLLFMRLSVIATDFFYIFALCRLLVVTASLHSTMHMSQFKIDGVQSSTQPSAAGELTCTTSDGPCKEGSSDPPCKENSSDSTLLHHKTIAAASLTLFNPALLLVDNMHFQYNGFILSVLLFALSLLMEERLSAGALMFSVAVNLKHTLLPVAPCIAFFLLYSVCRSSKYYQLSYLRSIAGVFEIVSSVFAVLFVSWTPLLLLGGSDVVVACLKRMFPFDRGLLHAFWAPNIWALYALSDKVLSILGCKLREGDVDIMSGHIGAHRPFVCLPNPTPKITTLLFVVSILPVMAGMTFIAFRTRRGISTLVCYLPRFVSYCALSAFVFGWHVHEKMILLAIVPLGASFLSGFFPGDSLSRFAYAFLLLGGALSCHSLVDGLAESAVKFLLYIVYGVYATLLLTSWRDGNVEQRGVGRQLSCAVGAYFVGGVLLELYCGAGKGHKLLFGYDRLEFLPLLLVSVYSALGVIFGYALLLCDVLICFKFD